MSGGSGFQVDEHGPRYYEACVGRFMQPFVDVLVGAVVRSGDAVLDVACGTGFATRAASERVGQGGRVVGSDLNAHMLAMARSLPHAPNVSWEQASALELPFGDDDFNAVICQQGSQFFPSPSAGLQEMARVATRDIAVTVWSPMEDSPYLAAMCSMLSEYCGIDPNEYERTFRTRADIASWFREAGLTVASIEPEDALVALPPVGDYLPDHLKTIPFAARFFELDARVQAEAVRAVAERMESYQSAGGLRVPFRSYLAVSRVR